MSDEVDWEYEEEFPEERPFGPKPFGPKPFGPKPFGPKPFGPKPFGPKPFGPKPFGPKPFGPKPFGPKPFGPKPFGPKGPDDGFLDREAWSAEIAALACERSAVIRLGATLVASDAGESVPIVAFKPSPGFRAPGKPEPSPGTPAGDPPELRPGDWRLSAGVVLSSRLRVAVAETPDLASVLGADLAEALARGADGAFLQGAGNGEPKGIAKQVTTTDLGNDPLATARQMVAAVQKTNFRNPGWILGSKPLEALTKLKTGDGLSQGGSGARSLDSYGLLQFDGMDGGMFLGFPFLISEAAGGNVYFAADWQEAWIGLHSYFVSVYVSAEPLPRGAEGIVLRAAMPLDFALRAPEAFACATGPATTRRRRS